MSAEEIPALVPWFRDNGATVYQGDALETLRLMLSESVNCCVTSPPYWGLRDYGVDGQMGLERTPEEYVAAMVAVFREVRRVLRTDGTLWLNLGDSYAREGGSAGGGNALLHMDGISKRNCSPPDNLKPKDLVGIPWRLAFALQDDGWYLRSDIIWHKPNPMPESVKDRPTKSHEYLFLLAKSADYYYDHEAIKEPVKCPEANTPDDWARVYSRRRAVVPEVRQEKIAVESADSRPSTRNARTVWTIPTESYPDSHFATFPRALVRPCILAGCPEGGVVLDPFAGSGTTLEVARAHCRQSVGIELNPAYCELIRQRLRQPNLFMVDL